MGFLRDFLWNKTYLKRVILQITDEMGYKRFVEKRGKNYGPYVYESYRDSEGNVKKRYLGKAEKEKGKSGVFLGILAAAFVLAIAVFVFYSGILPEKFVEQPKNFFSNAWDSFVSVFSPQITGHMSMDVNEVSFSDKGISGNLQIKMKTGELIPGDAKIIVEQKGEKKEFEFSDFVANNANGEFYVEGANLDGSGQGYGFVSEKIIFPKVYFTLIIEDKDKHEEESSETGGAQKAGEESAPEETTETGNETAVQQNKTEGGAEDKNKTEEKESKKNETEGKITGKATGNLEESGEAENSGLITGSAVYSNEVQGEVSYGNDFEYKLINQTARIKSGSITTEYGRMIEFLFLKTQVLDDKIIISTDYNVSKKGFGEEFLTDEEHVLEIPLDNMNISGGEGNLKISLVYDGKKFAEAKKKISSKNGVLVLEDEGAGNETAVNATEINITGQNVTNATGLNETGLNLTEFNLTGLQIIRQIEEIVINKNSQYLLNVDDYFINYENYSVSECGNVTFSIDGANLLIIPDENFTGARSSRIDAYSGNLSLGMDFNISVAEAAAIGNATIEKKQYKAVINRPVKWLAKVNKTIVSEIELPKEASNIIIITGGEVAEAEMAIENYEKEIEEKNREDLITGNIVIDINENQGILTRFWNWIRKLGVTGNVISEDELGENIIESDESKVVDLTNIEEQEIAVEYYTPAPTANETNISNGKEIVISADDVYNYTDILAYTLFDNEALNKVAVNDTGLRLIWHASYEDAVKYGYVGGGKISGVNEEINEENEANEITSNTEQVNESEEINEVIEENNLSITGNVIKNKEKGGMVSNWLSPDSISNKGEYLNISIDDTDSHSRMAEWSTQLVVTQRPSGHAGSIPAPAVTNSLTGKAISSEIADSDNLENKATEEAINKTPSYVDISISYDAYDLDEDGYVDYIEWNVPHLSSQTYTIIIEISKAEHLDEDYAFIEDVYEQVKAKDGNYTEIPDSHYLRVTFEQNLTKEKDITIYARAGCNGSVEINGIEVPCEIYEKKLRIEEIKKEMENE